MIVKKYPVVLSLLISLFLFSSFQLEWGFFGHRRINRMAVFTLPTPLVGFYKKHINFITEHAVDPDKRRYATKHEGVRHYMDLDRFGEAPFDDLPRNWLDALMYNTSIFIVSEKGDTLELIDGEGDLNQLNLGRSTARIFGRSVSKEHISIDSKQYHDFFYQYIFKQYYEDDWMVDCDRLGKLFVENRPNGQAALGLIINCKNIIAVDHLSENGILPYHLISMQKSLTEAMQKGHTKRILQLSADFGHYIGDAHVPLHTTENYNGQLTDQVGIHAFWESRIPELFADKTFDYFVGQAKYIDDPKAYYWDVVLNSHQYVDSVLLIEKEMSFHFPEDQQYCYEERLNRTVRVQCEAYAEAYRNRMKGMVEQQFQKAILAVSSAWYTAWVDAGQPKLWGNDGIAETEEEQKAREELDALYRSGAIKGRSHN